jgi:transcription elongation GreA/GreB family factor
MGVLQVISRRGDDRVTWESTKLEVDDPEVLAAVREAERIFQEQKGRGATAFKVEKGHVPVRIDQFDVEAEQIVLVPRVVGG